MDMMSLMMSSTPQSCSVPCMGSNSAGQATDASGKLQQFATLLGKSLQANLVETGQEAFVGTEKSASDLVAQLKDLLSQQGTDSGVAVQNESEAFSGKELNAMPVIQLLNALKIRMGDSVKGAKGNVSTEGGDIPDAELMGLLGQDGKLLPEVAENLRGRLNPAVVEKVAVLEKLIEEAVGSKPEAKNAGDQLTALLAALNGLIPQTPPQSIDKNVVTVKEAVQAPLVLPMVQAEQQNAATAQEIETAAFMSNLASEDTKPVVQGTEPEKVASDKSGASFFALPEQKNAEPSQGELPAKPAKLQNPQALIHPTSEQLSALDETRGGQFQRSLKDATIEVVIKEGEPIQENLNPTAEKQGVTASGKLVTSETGMLHNFSSEGKSHQLLAERPVSEDSLVKVTREQIVSQVREKLAEHRITQENGQITLRLNPAELGEIKIMVRMDDQRLRVEIIAENRTVKDALMENLGSLKESLAKQNLEMKQFDVSTGSRQFFNQGFREGRQNEQQYAATRHSGWLTGRSEDLQSVGEVSWKRSDNGLLDMMM